MNRGLFNYLFALGEVRIGPLIISSGYDGNWIGSVLLFPTKKNVLLKEKNYTIGIREYNNAISDEIILNLDVFTISKSEFDKFINQYYLNEWLATKDEKKPDISCFLHRVYS